MTNEYLRKQYLYQNQFIMNKFYRIVTSIILLLVITSNLFSQNKSLKVSENARFLTYSDNSPFFWLGDTGWLLFSKLSREDVVTYLDDRKNKGFNVIQIMVLHALPEVNFYGDTACSNNNPAMPICTPNSSYQNPTEYDYWDHCDFVVNEAEKRGIFVALVPAWGSIVKAKQLNSSNVAQYAKWLAKRYQYKTNIIWVVGGDIRGNVQNEVWETMGKTLKAEDPNHLITFHPFGRTSSSQWFANSGWLDFNMFQSGHRRYDQVEKGDANNSKGEDNWRYVYEDLSILPRRPTLDGEPSYEGIPQGLHDTLQARWQACDLRRYAYWSVFAGGFGFTYGNNSVMQFYTKGKGAYGANVPWPTALNDPGAGQMQHLKNLMLSKDFTSRVADSSIIVGALGHQYDYLATTRGKDWLMVYDYTGRPFQINGRKLPSQHLKYAWYDPRLGIYSKSISIENKDILDFAPPEEKKNGDDWVLVLEGRE